jgi:hypothetical protein
MVIEGRARRATDVTAFPRWARLLRMDDYGFEHDGDQSWCLDDGTWVIRIVSGPSQSTDSTT